MSSLVLLNSNGTIAQKLQLVSLPDDYVVPPDTIISWRTERTTQTYDTEGSLRLEPVEAFFYLRGAQGQVRRDSIRREFEKTILPSILNQGGVYYRYIRALTITVQGTSARDVRELRDHILHRIHTGARWKVENDLNPYRRLNRFFRFIGAGLGSPLGKSR